MNRKTKRTKKSEVKRIGLDKIGNNFPAMVSVIISILLTLILMACGSTPSTSPEITIQPALPTPTLEPTFTPSPSSTDTPVPKPTDVPAPEPTPTPVPPASLSGLILGQESNQPIAEAEVTVGDRTTTTNANGLYILTDLEPGQYVLSVTHPDYDPGLSSIFTVAGGEKPVVDVALYEPDTSPYPQDPMLTNPLDPNGAPTKEDAERLAREQGLTGEVVSIKEIHLSGEYLVNYKIGDNVRAAVAELNHEVWELTDDAGQTWWIIKVCGNLSSPLPAQKPIPTPKPISLPPMAEVLVDELIVRACASEECAEVGTVPHGGQVEVFGCLAEEGDWCEVGWSGGRGWCTGRSLRQLAIAEVVPVVEVQLSVEALNERATDQRIAFVSDRDGQEDVYVMNIDGNGLQRLTHHPAEDSFLAWSWDGQQLYFASDEDGVGNFESSYVIDFESGNLTPKLNQGGCKPSFYSPDCQRIAFMREGDIYVQNADGNDLRRLTNSPAIDSDFEWSPNGLKIVFVSDRDGNAEIYAVTVDGSSLTRLTNSPDTLDHHPTWSPDSRRIAFEAYRDGNSDIYVMNSDGSGLTRLTDNQTNDSSPTWSPDGRHIAFESYRDGNREIYVMNADGTGLIRLTNHPAEDNHPTWSR